LVVDDFAPWRRFVSTIAQKEPGWQVISEASDGLEAVQKTEELTPDLILLDISLPNLSGIEVAKQIRKVAPNSKILFVSTHASWEIVEGALDTGASGYVVKADAGNELAKAVEAVFQGKRYISSRLMESTSAIPADAQAPERPGQREGLTWPSTPSLLRKTEFIRCHEVQFYSNESVFLERVTYFIGAALKSGNPAIVFATKPHRDGLLQHLKFQGMDVDAAIQQGAFVSLDAADTLSTFMVNGWPDADRFLEGFRNLIQSASSAAPEVAGAEVAPAVEAAVPKQPIVEAVKAAKQSHRTGAQFQNFAERMGADAPRPETLSGQIGGLLRNLRASQPEEVGNGWGDATEAQGLAPHQQPDLEDLLRRSLKLTPRTP
jgi:DNA-binding NarL/FixJ family response regulator